MIQDIYPAKLDNTYTKRPWENDNPVLLFQGSTVLYGSAGFPHAGGYEHGELLYLFRIGDKHYYLGEYTEIPGYELCAIRTLLPGSGRDDRFAAVTGHHLEEWYRRHRYCGSCRSELVHSENERMMECPVCHAQYFPQISPAVIVGVIHGEKLLVSRYAGRTSGYALIAGYTEIGETPEETVHREVREETGLEVTNLRYYKSQPWGISGSLLLGYYCELEGSETVTLDEKELSLAEWKERRDLPEDRDGISLTAEMIQRFRDLGHSVIE